MEMLPPDQEPLAIREAGSDKGALSTAERYVTWFSKILFWIAGAGLVGMTALVVGDVIGIKIFSKPIPGGIEFVSFLAAVAIAFGVPFTQVMKGHVAVDFIVETFPRRLKLVIECITVFLSVVLFALLMVYSFRYAGLLRSSGEVSMTQKIPFHPFVYGMAVCFLATLLVLILQFVRTVLKAGKQWTP
jgi:TRAP-type C4-dicarboxylate transport system permease small subunit